MEQYENKEMVYVKCQHLKNSMDSFSQFITEQQEEIKVNLLETVKKQAIAEIQRCYMTNEEDQKFQSSFVDYVFAKISKNPPFNLEDEMWSQLERYLKAKGLDKELQDELNNRYAKLSQDIKEDSGA